MGSLRSDISKASENGAAGLVLRRFDARQFGTIVLACWITTVPSLLLALHTKLTLLTVRGGWLEMLRQSGTTETKGWGELSALLGALFTDVVFGLLLWPLGISLLLLTCTRGPRSRCALLCIINTSVATILFVELKCFWQVGAFLPYPVLIAGLHEGVGRELLVEYVPLTSLVKLVTMLTATLGLSAYAAQLPIWSHTLRRSHLVTPILCFSFVGAGAAHSGLHDREGITASITLQAMFAFGGFGNAERFRPGNATPLTTAELRTAYGRLANSPEPPRPTSLFGSAAGYDVLLFGMETGPAAVIDVESERFPTTRRLANRAFLPRRHYTTYPYTARAIYSMYTSLYPSNFPRDFITGLSNRDVEPRTEDRVAVSLHAPGFIRTLRNHGYATSIVVPHEVDDWERNRDRFDALGFERLQSLNPTELKSATSRGDRTEGRRQADLRALDIAKVELRRLMAAGRPYALAFHPQYGHGPWPGISDQSNWEETLRAGERLFTEQDRWLADLVQILEEGGRLERTLIIVTADHGIRTREEHPTFIGGMVADATFHVPFLLFAPGVIDRAHHILAPSSHIDISPSILDLIGIEDGRDLEQGLPLWDPALEHRVIFLLGRNYLGADALVRGRSATMLHAMTGWTFGRQDGSIDFRVSDRQDVDLIQTYDIQRTFDGIGSLAAEYFRQVQQDSSSDGEIRTEPARTRGTQYGVTLGANRKFHKNVGSLQGGRNIAQE